MTGARSAIVIGAGRGIGAAVARALARDGHAVVVAARSLGPLEALTSEIAAVGGEARPVVADMADPASLRDAVAAAVDLGDGRLDVAVNAAATTSRPTPLADVEERDFTAAVSSDLGGLFAALRAELVAMRRSGGGAIVNVASTAGLRGVPGLAAYVATKHAMVGLTQVAALDHAADGIRVNAVAPGPTLNDRMAGLPEHVQETIAASVPLGRIGRPEEIAELVAWLCSERASFVSGATVGVDGGRLAGHA